MLLWLLALGRHARRFLVCLVTAVWYMEGVAPSSATRANPPPAAVHSASSETCPSPLAELRVGSRRGAVAPDGAGDATGHAPGGDATCHAPGGPGLVADSPAATRPVRFAVYVAVCRSAGTLSLSALVTAPCALLRWANSWVPGCCFAVCCCGGCCCAARCSTAAAAGRRLGQRAAAAAGACVCSRACRSQLWQLVRAASFLGPSALALHAVSGDALAHSARHSEALRRRHGLATRRSDFFGRGLLGLAASMLALALGGLAAALTVATAPQSHAADPLPVPTRTGNGSAPIPAPGPHAPGGYDAVDDLASLVAGSAVTATIVGYIALSALVSVAPNSLLSHLTSARVCYTYATGAGIGVGMDVGARSPPLPPPLPPPFSFQVNVLPDAIVTVQICIAIEVDSALPPRRPLLRRALAAACSGVAPAGAARQGDADEICAVAAAESTMTRLDPNLQEPNVCPAVPPVERLSAEAGSQPSDGSDSDGLRAARRAAAGPALELMPAEHVGDADGS